MSVEGDGMDVTPPIKASSQSQVTNSTDSANRRSPGTNSERDTLDRNVVFTDGTVMTILLNK